MELITRDTNTALKVDEAIFSYDYNESLVHQAVVTYMNNARSGNSAQKTRAEVRGGGKKPWSQKGTGRARAGTLTSPIMRSGGVTFASKPRDYTQKINKKMYNRALRSVFSELIRRERLVVLNDFKCDNNKTKEFLSKMQSLNVTSALIIMHEVSEFEYLGSRNLINFDVCDVVSIDPVSLLRFEYVVVTAEAMKGIEELLQ